MDTVIVSLGWLGMIGTFAVAFGAPLVGILMVVVLLVGIWDGPLGEGGVRGWLRDAMGQPAAPETHVRDLGAPARP